jgi:Ser/Thr protein kinase RdoA (MazF antagonist)
LNQHPYEALTPDVVVDALASVGLMCDGRLLALSSYENRVYLLHLEEGGAVVAKFYRPARWSEAQILEEHAFAFELVAAEVPVVAPLVLQGATLHQFGGFFFSVCPRRGGRAPDLDDEDVLPWIGRFLARLHVVGAKQPFAHRPALNYASFGQESRDYLLQSPLLPLEVSREWAETTDAALAMVAEHSALCGETGASGANEDRPIAQLRTHGDCHPGNILWTPQGQSDAGPHFVDLDDARTSVAVQDLWMLLEGERAQRSYQLSAMLEGYEQIRPFDRRELALIEPLRTLRLVHYSAWLARRWQDPSFPLNFPWFGSVNYWQDQIVQMREQCEAMAQPVLNV